MDIDIAKRHITHELQTEHHHPGDPEEDNVEAGDQYIGRVESLELQGLIWPA